MKPKPLYSGSTRERFNCLVFRFKALRHYGRGLFLFVMNCGKLFFIRKESVPFNRITMDMTR
jgi:hypothetical protein